MNVKNLKNADEIKSLLAELARQQALPSAKLSSNIMQKISEKSQEQSRSLGVRLQEFLLSLSFAPIVRYATICSVVLILALGSITTLGRPVESTFKAQQFESAEIETSLITKTRLLDVLEANFGKASYVPSGFSALSLTLLAGLLLSKRRYVGGIISALLAALFALAPLMLSPL